MKRHLFFTLLAMLFIVSCSKEDTPNRPAPQPQGQPSSEEETDTLGYCNSLPLYGIYEDIKYFTPRCWTGVGITSDWVDAPGDWDPENPGKYEYIDVQSTFGGSWEVYFTGPLINLTNDQSRYEQICLDWGVRIDHNEVESEALKNLPFIKYLGPIIVANHGITRMDLITERDFDKDHPAGSSLGDITTISFYSEEPYFAGETNDKNCHKAVLMKDIDASTLQRFHWNFFTTINRKPQKAGTYVFRQSIYFADGKVLERRFKRVWLPEHMN